MRSCAVQLLLQQVAPIELRLVGVDQVAGTERAAEGDSPATETEARTAGTRTTSGGGAAGLRGVGAVAGRTGLTPRSIGGSAGTLVDIVALLTGFDDGARRMAGTVPPWIPGALAVRGRSGAEQIATRFEPEHP